MRHWWAALLAGSALWAQELPAPKYQRPAPEQPIPFSHRVHAGQLKLACKQCHPMPEPGDFAELPATTVCMDCHASVAKDSPPIARLARWHCEGKKVPWAPVYRIPDYVFFSHKVHTATVGAACSACHGPVAERDVMRREKDIGMAACMDCHRATKGSLACNYCHEQK